jgi:hypothetical protein
MSPPGDSLQRYDFTGLTPNDYMDMDLGPIFGLNSHFGAVLGRNLALFRALGSLHFAQQLGLSKSNGPLLLEIFLKTALRLCRSFSGHYSISRHCRIGGVGRL